MVNGNKALPSDFPDFQHLKVIPSWPPFIPMDHLANLKTLAPGAAAPRSFTMPIVHPYLSSPSFKDEEILEDGVEEVVDDDELCKPNDPEKQEWFQDLLDSLLDFLPLSNAGDVEESTDIDAFADRQVPKKRRTGQVRRRAWSLDPPERLLYDHLLRDGGDFSMLKKCTHCITMDTPQWRNGPAGPGTLCNACGIRYKSGRLLPEYRPASSPAFGISGYANNHKKVLKIRKTKKSRGDDEDVLC